MMQLPIPDDWDAESFCKWAVCWPDSPKWKAILSGLLEMPAQGRFWDFKTGNFLETRGAFFPAYLYNFELKGVLMSCNDTELTAAFNNIAASIMALANKTGQGQCCDSVDVVVNNTFQAIVTQPEGGNDIPVYGSEPPLGLEPGTFPDNYESEEAYLLDKCRIANMIFDGYISSMRNISTLEIIEITTLAGVIGAALAGVIIFPPSAIPILIAALFAVAVHFAVLNAVLDELEDRRAEVICILYTSEAVGIMIARLADLIDVAIAAVGTTTVIGAAIKAFLLVLINTDTLNQLFSGAAALGYPDAECPCVEGYLWHFDEDDMGWVWEQVSGGQTRTPGNWTSDICGEGALTMQVQTAVAFLNQQKWSLTDLPGTVGNIQGGTLAVDVSGNFFPVTYNVLVTFVDDTTSGATYNPGAAGEFTLTLANKVIKDIELTMGFDGGSNPSYDFNTCIGAVEVR